MKLRKCLFWSYTIGFYFLLRLFSSTLFVFLSNYILTAVLLGIGVIIAILITLGPAIKQVRENQEKSDRRFVLSFIYSLAVLFDYVILLMRLYLFLNF